MQIPEFLAVCNVEPPRASTYYKGRFLMEDMSMCSKANAPDTTQEHKQSGCCCGSSSAAPKSTTTETHKTAAPVEQDSAVNEIAGDRSDGCCGAH